MFKARRALSRAVLLSLGLLAVTAGCSTKETVAADDSCADCCAPASPATQPAGGVPAAATKPSTQPAGAAVTSAAQPMIQSTAAASEWKDLFDGKSLKNWKVADYAGKGEPAVENGLLMLPSGEGLTGVTWTGEALPKTNYELAVVAKRIDGVDFFSGITFPVNDSFATFVPGGWGGAVVGISNIDDEDAAHNETTTYEKFEKDRFYTLKVRVEPDHLSAWIDDKQVVDVTLKDRKISIRGDIDQSTPLGLATWQTTGGVKSVRLRTLPASK